MSWLFGSENGWPITCGSKTFLSESSHDPSQGLLGKKARRSSIPYHHSAKVQPGNAWNILTQQFSSSLPPSLYSIEKASLSALVDVAPAWPHRTVGPSKEGRVRGA